MTEFEVYFYDLMPHARKALLKAAKLKSEKEANWDVFPITVIEVEGRAWLKG